MDNDKRVTFGSCPQDPFWTRGSVDSNCMPGSCSVNKTPQCQIGFDPDPEATCAPCKIDINPGPASYFKRGCKGKDPQMAPASNSGPGLTTLKCCTDFGFASGKTCDVGSQPVYCCGTGFCPDGNACGKVMTDYCLKYGETAQGMEVCKNFLKLTLNPSSRASVASNFLQSKLQPASTGGSGVCSKMSLVECSTNSKTKPVVEDVIEICNLAPGACNELLKEYCSTVKQSDLVGNTTLTKLCGCFLPASEYKFGGIVDTECSPVCVWPGGICISESVPENVLPVCKTCKQGNCIISDVNINQINSQGSVNFNQYCPASSNPATSNCYIDNLVINEINSEGRIALGQNCNKCFTYSAKTGESSEVNCKTFKPMSKGIWGKLVEWFENNVKKSFGVVIGLIVIVIIFMVVIEFSGHKKSHSTQTIPSQIQTEKSEILSQFI